MPNVHCRNPQWCMSQMGHERRFREVRDESGLPSTPERLLQSGELTLRAKSTKSLRGSGGLSARALTRSEIVDSGRASCLGDRCVFDLI
jgi:hypothetical protein